MRPRVAFLLDVDNTLLDHDAVIEDYKRHMIQEFGEERQKRYWAIFDKRRAELGYADYLGALEGYRDENPRDPHALRMSFYLLDYPFAKRLYPRALDVVRRLSSRGPTVIVSDGDVIFQPRKIERSGLYSAVEGRVLLYIHKERELDDVKERYPADHYVLVDDKPRILATVKESWGERVTTVLPRAQGHYARDARSVARYPAPDVTIDAIGDLLEREVG